MVEPRIVGIDSEARCNRVVPVLGVTGGESEMRPELRDRIERRETALAGVVDMLITSLHVERAPDEFDPDTPLFGTGLALDSVDAVEIVVALERKFGVSLDEDQAPAALRTINTLVDAVAAETSDPA